MVGFKEINRSACDANRIGISNLLQYFPPSKTTIHELEFEFKNGSPETFHDNRWPSKNQNLIRREKPNL